MDSMEMVGEFITKFDASHEPALWEKLIVEEAQEVRVAFGNLLKEISDLVYVTNGYEITGGDMHKSVDGFEDVAMILYWLQGIPDSIREEAFNRVHQSNMSKLGSDGKPVKREDGKILKGPHYVEADLSDIAKSY